MTQSALIEHHRCLSVHQPRCGRLLSARHLAPLNQHAIGVAFVRSSSSKGSTSPVSALPLLAATRNRYRAARDPG